jgi:hypothetical protein
MPSTRSLVLSALLVLAPVPASFAQEPKLGNDWYQDEVDLGFKVKAPRDWNFVPGSPLEQNLIGKYTADNGQYVSLGRDAFVEISLYLVKFDRRPEPGAGAEGQAGETKIKVTPKGFQDADEWMTRGIDHGSAWRRIDELKPVRSDLPSKVSLYEGLSTTRSGGSGNNAEPQPIKAYVAVFTLSPELDVALIGLGPADKRKWRTYESAYGSFAKTLQAVEVQALAGATGKDPRSLKRAKLEMEVAKSPGWSLHETPNYFILSCYDDRAFIEELKLRLEGIRAVYEQDYPPEMSRKIKVVASHDPENGEPEGKEDEEEEEEPDPNRTVGAVDALELGKSSVVRLCKDREQYQQYGLPHRRTQGTGQERRGESVGPQAPQSPQETRARAGPL